MFFVYILYNKIIDRYYTGHTSNLTNRLADHNNQGHRTKYTRKQIGAWKLVYKEEFQDKRLAIMREKEIKSKKSREFILSLIKSSPA